MAIDLVETRQAPHQPAIADLLAVTIDTSQGFSPRSLPRVDSIDSSLVAVPLSAEDLIPARVKRATRELVEQGIELSTCLDLTVPPTTFHSVNIYKRGPEGEYTPYSNAVSDPNPIVARVRAQILAVRMQGQKSDGTTYIVPEPGEVISWQKPAIYVLHPNGNDVLGVTEEQYRIYREMNLEPPSLKEALERKRELDAANK